MKNNSNINDKSAVGIAKSGSEQIRDVGVNSTIFCELIATTIWIKNVFSFEIFVTVMLDVWIIIFPHHLRLHHQYLGDKTKQYAKSL